MPADDATKRTHDRAYAKRAKGKQRSHNRIKAWKEYCVEHQRGRCSVDVKVVPFHATAKQAGKGRKYGGALRLSYSAGRHCVVFHASLSRTGRYFVSSFFSLLN